MAKKKDKDYYKRKRPSILSSLKDETLHGVIAILAFLVAVITLLSRFGKAGWAGDHIYFALSWLLGVGYYLIPLVFGALGILYLKNLHRDFDSLKLVGSLLFILSVLGIIDVISPTKSGMLGSWTSWPFTKLFGDGASIVILSAMVVISIMVAFNTELDAARFLFWRKKKDEEEEKPKKKIEEVEIKIAESEKTDKRQESDKKEKVAAVVPLQLEEEFIKKGERTYGKTYEPPPLSILERDSGKPGVGDIKANANMIKRTLANFGIDVEMDEISIGPSVTRYALKPAEGVKLARIVALQNDLSLALAAHPIRIEAPIPGKSLVGIEIPNTTKTTVGLGTLLESEEFQNSDKHLLVSLGRGISGKSHFANLGKMPHLLIAGATGSGKSVTIHTIITSLLYRNSPDDMKMIMIDPKRVELTLYNKIPHLYAPVITDAKKAILALRWAAGEMDRRYDVLQKAGARDIDSYHQGLKTRNVKLVTSDKKEKGSEEEKLPERMPYIIIVIDELADIMATYPRELEAGIVRLAQMSRAIGIHLMLSTQRPSVNVITGLIKANIPARIALQVSSQVDSRTILDGIGAEKLLGAGDMLYMSGEMSKPQRIQSAYISEGEVKKVVKYLVDAYRDELQDEITLTDVAVADKNALFSASLDQDELGEDDDMYNDAKAIVMETGKASTSYFQRKLRVGYSRAARLMDLLEERGVIGPADGSKARSVIGAVVSEKPTEGGAESEVENI